MFDTQPFNKYMALVGFHFSNVYEEALRTGAKTATILDGQHHFKVGQEVLIYISDKPNLLEGQIERRMGKAIVTKVGISKIKEITAEQARLCGHRNWDELWQSLVKWYGCNQDSIMTYVEFIFQIEEV